MSPTTCGLWWRQLPVELRTAPRQVKGFCQDSFPLGLDAALPPLDVRGCGI
ncbi:MAG: hypothetical protein ACM3XO_11455 [Bacteroidota bacterium]